MFINKAERWHSEVLAPASAANAQCRQDSDACFADTAPSW